MSYRFPENNEKADMMTFEWFEKSYTSVYNSLYNQKKASTVNEVDAEYERLFDVKLIIGRDSGGNFEPIVGVEFRSKEQATMFILQWS